MKILRRIAIGVVVVVALVVVAGFAFLRLSGAWGALFPSSVHESEPPALPELREPALLVFTKTNGFRHVDGIDAGVAFFRELAGRRGWSMFHTENGAVFNDEQLAHFSVVIFHNATGDLLDESQEGALVRFLEAGGGWVGTHAAGDGSHESWEWYVDTLIGAPYIAHPMGPQFQRGRIEVEDHDHPATRDLPAEWMHVEEWYSWEASPRTAGFRVLATVDESTYEPWVRMFGSESDLRMGDHPVLWTSCIGRGRAFYSALGHQGEAYATPEYRGVLEGAVAWAARRDGVGCD